MPFFVNGSTMQGYPPFFVTSPKYFASRAFVNLNTIFAHYDQLYYDCLPSNFCISRLHYAYRGFTFSDWPDHNKTKRNDLPKPWPKPIIRAKHVYSYYPLVIPSFSLTLVDGFMGLHVNIWDLFVGVHDLLVGIMA